MDKQEWLIVAPPPTPNGDLHVGHIAGPYFAADVMSRYLKLKQQNVVYALSVDLNQSYVVTTAERLNTNPVSLATKSHEQISQTLAMSQIEFDTVGMPDAEYTDYVATWFSDLYAAGVFEKRRRMVPYDSDRKRFLFESYASGRCPICLAGTNGNICEACGHPNGATELFGLHSTGGEIGKDRLESREVVEYILPLENYRDVLWNHLNNEVSEKRPTLQRLLDELFEKPLPDFPITFQSDWGMGAPFPDSDNLVINVWAEMVPGHYHWLKKAQGSGTNFFNNEEVTSNYVQFLGFDNSFFYCVAQLALAFAAKDACIDYLLPKAFVTNEFYLMENFKFSTSQGHLIWARDILKQVDPEELRFYLSWTNPEYNQANFTKDDFEAVVEKKLRRPVEMLFDTLIEAKDTPLQSSLEAQAVLARFDSAYGVKGFSLRILAQTIANGLSFANETNNGNQKEIASAVAIGMAPIMPNLAQKIWLACGHSRKISWQT